MVAYSVARLSAIVGPLATLDAYAKPYTIYEYSKRNRVASKEYFLYNTS